MKKNDSKYYSFDDIYIEFIIVEDDNNLSVFGYVNIQQKKVRVITDMSSSLFIKTDVYNSEFHNTEISKNILAEIMILVGSPTKYKNEEDGTVIAPLLSMDSYLSNKKYFKFCIKNVLLK